MKSEGETKTYLWVRDIGFPLQNLIGHQSISQTASIDTMKDPGSTTTTAREDRPINCCWLVTNDLAGYPPFLRMVQKVTIKRFGFSPATSKQCQTGVAQSSNRMPVERGREVTCLLPSFEALVKQPAVLERTGWRSTPSYQKRAFTPEVSQRVAHSGGWASSFLNRNRPLTLMIGRGEDVIRLQPSLGAQPQDI